MASQQYSSDPFAPNYRHICPWSAQEKAEYIATWPVPLQPNFWEVYESAEHAEWTRPRDQLDVLLRERGLEEVCNTILYSEQKTEHGTDMGMDERQERVRELLRDAGELALLEKAEKIWRMMAERNDVQKGKKSIEHLFEIGDEAGFRWLKMNPDWVRTDHGERSK
ncbi:hypothetical protein P153DRAFT_384580 [Dothidotthia symphoricarpi CBS 119687]|uniref:Uncharacterized protein n=1 Tax=Dothidotthia symphoricarpi CBS 119687 TaxID=1392245 RepID=A0A6A6AIP6_9PLEO|nr:uncharacterized protein P153DRAFT_384580 [Dothidotthia symphoricarpi CBS 119687]KAF2130301.1 hypothetical protein P153DRAFT_384580 [Dothidotthia symphoricarpi CBS 119687]